MKFNNNSTRKTDLECARQKRGGGGASEATIVWYVHRTQDFDTIIDSNQVSFTHYVKKRCIYVSHQSAIDLLKSCRCWAVCRPPLTSKLQPTLDHYKKTSNTQNRWYILNVPWHGKVLSWQEFFSCHGRSFFPVMTGVFNDTTGVFNDTTINLLFTNKQKAYLCNFVWTLSGSVKTFPWALKKIMTDFREMGFHRVVSRTRPRFT